MRLESMVEIERPAAAVWPWLVDSQRLGLWMKGVESDVPADAGPPRVGSRYTMRIKEGRKVAEYARVLTAVEPPRRIAMDMSGGSFGKNKLNVEYTLEDFAGRTKLVCVHTCELVGAWRVFSFFFGWFFGWFAKMQAKGFFAKLKQLAEAEGR